MSRFRVGQRAFDVTYATAGQVPGGAIDSVSIVKGCLFYPLGGGGSLCGQLSPLLSELHGRGWWSHDAEEVVALTRKFPRSPTPVHTSPDRRW